MTVKTPAELKTLYESISFDLQTTYTGRWGRNMLFPAPICAVGAHRRRGWRSAFTAKAAAVSP